MRFNLSRLVMCVAMLVVFMLSITSAPRAQAPSIATAVPDESAKAPARGDKNEPSVTAVSKEIARDSSAPADSTPDTKNVAPPLTDMQSVRKQDSSDDSGWHFGVAPYLFVAGIHGTVGARGRSLELGSSAGDVLAALDAGFMAAVEARKGRFVSFNDLLWVKLSSEKDTPGRFYSTAKVGVSLFIFDPEVGYRFVDSKKGSVDVLAGVRIWSVGATLNTTSGVLPGFDVSQRKSWAAPVVGVRGVANITKRFFLTGKFDIGGAGIGADLTTQLYGGAGYKITKHFALIGGYRWLQVDYDDGEGFLFDTQMSGALLGAKFSW